MPHKANQTSFKKGHEFIKGGEKGWFKKGFVPWNKDLKGVMKRNKTSFKKGQVAWNKGLKGYGEGEKHPLWKGEKAGYLSKHSWMSRKFGKPDTCKLCKKSGLKGRQIHWANKSGKYFRDISDWIRLCASCHKKYDNEKLKYV